jgi:hypothetical protein
MITKISPANIHPHLEKTMASTVTAISDIPLPSSSSPSLLPTNSASLSPALDPPPPIPPDPGSSHQADLSIAHSDSLMKSWSSLFASKPRNAGTYTPLEFNIDYRGSPLPPPDVLMSEGMNFWEGYLVGFFLGVPVNYMAVVSHFKKTWKLKGSYDIKSDGANYFIKFSCLEDKQTVLRADPSFIRGQMFVITTWKPAFGSVQSQVKSVPIWIQLYNIPHIAWTLIGINWIACHLGKLICFNEATEKRERMEYAKCLVEISPEKELPEFLLIGDGVETSQKVYIEYNWRPLICTACKVFGHSTNNCDMDKSISEEKVSSKKGVQVNESEPTNKNKASWQRNIIGDNVKNRQQKWKPKTTQVNNKGVESDITKKNNVMNTISSDIESQLQSVTQIETCNAFAILSEIEEGELIEKEAGTSSNLRVDPDKLVYQQRDTTEINNISQKTQFQKETELSKHQQDTNKCKHKETEATSLNSIPVSQNRITSAEATADLNSIANKSVSPYAKLKPPQNIPLFTPSKDDNFEGNMSSSSDADFCSEDDMNEGYEYNQEQIMARLTAKNSKKNKNKNSSAMLKGPQRFTRQSANKYK